MPTGKSSRREGKRQKAYNNFMKDKRTHRPRNENLKTESSVKPTELELGKLVRLPYIRKISQHNQHHPSSLDRPENRALRNSHK
jgi:hypothetical protein